MKRTLAAGCLAVLGWLASLGLAGVIYVDDDAPAGGNGANWNTAYQFLQDALTAAVANDEIRVAGGTHRPDRDAAHPGGTGSRSATFHLKNGVAVHGGYAGLADPNDPDRRDFVLFESVLSGDLAGNDGPNFANYADNSHHVATGTGADTFALLDGFTVRGGNTSGAPVLHGGGFYAGSGAPLLQRCKFVFNRSDGRGGGGYLVSTGRPLIASCTFSGNYCSDGGGGIGVGQGDVDFVDCEFASNNNILYGGGLAFHGASNVTMTRCVVRNNLNCNSGGAMYCGVAAAGNLTMVDCAITNNSAVYIGGIMERGGHATLMNCIIAGNTANGSGQWGFGGGLGCSGSSTTTSVLTNCTIVGNSGTTYGGGVSCYESASTTLNNCVLWGNTAPNGAQIAIGNRIAAATVSVRYGDSQGGAAAVYVGTGSTLNWGPGNIDANPLFVSPGAGDYRLGGGSPCIDAGDNAAVSRDASDLDMDGCRTDWLSDLDGNLRFHDDLTTPDTGVGTGPIVDMGAYEVGAGPDTAPQPCPGDLNCDGTVGFGDINPFVLVLSNPSAWQASYPACDILNGDVSNNGAVAFDDINPFVALLSGP